MFHAAICLCCIGHVALARSQRTQNGQRGFFKSLLRKPCSRGSGSSIINMKYASFAIHTLQNACKYPILCSMF